MPLLHTEAILKHSWIVQMSNESVCSVQPHLSPLQSSCSFLQRIIDRGCFPAVCLIFPSSHSNMAQAVPPPRVCRPNLFINMSLSCIYPKLFRPLLINPISMLFERHFKLHCVLKISNLKWSNVTINLKSK